MSDAPAQAEPGQGAFRTMKKLHRGDGPIVLGMPHVGTGVPGNTFERLNENGRLLADTDWHVDRLFEGLLPSASVIQMNVHRYVIDANRDPEGKSLYPGQPTTDLVPLTELDGRAIWREGEEPTTQDVKARLAANHRVYHMALQLAVMTARERHGCAILFDCHSIRSVVPRLFAGTLPDLNIGDNAGTTCDPRIHEAVRTVADTSDYSVVSNGRFKGGWTTRHYGRPETGVHAIQLEIAQSTYLEEEKPPWRYDTAKADRLRTVLGAMLHGLDALARSGDLAP